MFSKGENIRFLYEKGEGKILEILVGKRYVIEDENGFESIYSHEEIVKIHQKEITLSDEINLVKDKVKIINKNRKDNKLEIPTIDLHAEEILSDFRQLTNYDILSKQMEVFHQFYQNAIQKRHKKICVIHGRGEGVLRSEIRFFLTGKKGVEFYDAEYQIGGPGATIIVFYHNLIR